MNYQEAYLIATSPTSNDHVIKNIISGVDVVSDDSWWPYIYHPFNCPDCQKSSGFYRKLWFGMFGLSDLAIYCHECSEERERLKQQSDDDAAIKPVATRLPAARSID